LLDPLQPFPSVKVVLPEHSRFVCFNEVESLAAEKFRFLATRLRHLQQKRSIKRLVVSSSVTGEGKSMVAANLACSLAAGKQQVLLVEGDLRRPSLGQQLGLQELPGLSQLLQGKSNSLNIYSLENFRLCVLLAGDVHTNPLEFMEPGRLSTLMDQVSTGFDWVVIDSPPLLPLADTSIWMRLADGVLLVTRPGVTSKKQLQRSFETIEQSKLLGSVLNASTEATTNHYYYHYTARSSGSPAPGSNPK
jgi:capsular exopolysaccharide synthesis family protein